MTVTALDNTIVGNTRNYLRTITPTRYADRVFKDITYKDNISTDETPQFRHFDIFINGYELGMFHNYPYNQEFMALLTIEIAYPVKHFEQLEIQNILLEDTQSIVNALNAVNMNESNTNLINFWFQNAEILADRNSEIYINRLSFKVHWESGTST